MKLLLTTLVFCSFLSTAFADFNIRNVSQETVTIVNVNNQESHEIPSQSGTTITISGEISDYQLKVPSTTLVIQNQESHNQLLITNDIKHNSYRDHEFAEDEGGIMIHQGFTPNYSVTEGDVYYTMNDNDALKTGIIFERDENQNLYLYMNTSTIEVIQIIKVTVLPLGLVFRMMTVDSDSDSEQN